MKALLIFEFEQNRFLEVMKHSVSVFLVALLILIAGIGELHAKVTGSEEIINMATIENTSSWTFEIVVNHDVVCPSEQVDFSVSSSLGDLTAQNLRWDFGDGSTASTNNMAAHIQHNFSSGGTYCVSVTADVSEPSIGDATVMVTMNIYVMEGDLERTIELIKGESEYVNVSNPGADGYSWTKNGVSESHSLGTRRLSEEGTYVVEIDYGSCSTTRTFIVNVCSTSFPEGKRCLLPDERVSLTAELCSGLAGLEGENWAYKWYYRTYDEEQAKWNEPEAIDASDPWVPLEGLAPTSIQIVLENDGSQEDYRYEYFLRFKRDYRRSASSPLEELLVDRGRAEIIYYKEEVLDFEVYSGFCTSIFVPYKASTPRNTSEISFNTFHEEDFLMYDYTWTDSDADSDFKFEDTKVKLGFIKSAGKADSDVTLDVSITYPGCPMSFDTDVEKRVDYSENVLGRLDRVEADIIHSKSSVVEASVSTYNSNWPVVRRNSLASDVLKDNPFQNGARGVWRPSSSYTHLSNRVYENQSLATNGTFSMDLFDFRRSGDYGAWKEMSRITRYNGYGKAEESKDIFDNYSSALYGYNGQLPVATGTNMRKNEMAFTSFEVFDGSGALAEGDGYSLGNWVIDGAGTEARYEVIGADIGQDMHSKFQFIILEGLELTDLPDGFTTEGIFYGINGAKINSRTGGFEGTQAYANLVCPPTEVISKDLILFEFDRPFAEKSPLTWASIFYRTDAVGGDGYQNITSSVLAHSGKYCLEIDGDWNVRQPLLALSAGKTYVMSMWVRGMGDRPNSSQINITAKVAPKATPGSPIVIESVNPSGAVIEGWQRAEVEFSIADDQASVSDLELQLDIAFGSGVGKIYIDDLRFFPKEGSMKSFVYDPESYRLISELDENNFASYYEYDKEGNLRLINKETAKGIRTIQESVTHTKTQ